MKKKALIILYIILCIPLFCIFALEALFYYIHNFFEKVQEKADDEMTILAKKIRGLR